MESEYVLKVESDFFAARLEIGKRKAQSDSKVNRPSDVSGGVRINCDEEDRGKGRLRGRARSSGLDALKLTARRAGGPRADAALKTSARRLLRGEGT